MHDAAKRAVHDAAKRALHDAAKRALHGAAKGDRTALQREARVPRQMGMAVERNQTEAVYGFAGSF